MDRILQDVNAVVGVTGSFVCNGEGEVLAQALPSVFDETTLSTVARIAAQTVAGLETARRRKVTDLDLVYGGGRLVVKNLGNGCLCVLCVRNINVALLNLTANLAVRKLAERLKAKEKPIGHEVKVPSGPIIDAVFFNKMAQELTKEMGPIAALIIDEEVTALGEDKDSFPHEKAAELVERVSTMIGKEEKRLRFQRIMRETLGGL